MVLEGVGKVRMLLRNSSVGWTPVGVRLKPNKFMVCSQKVNLAGLRTMP